MMKLRRFLAPLTLSALLAFSWDASARDLTAAERSLYLDATDLPWMRRHAEPTADDSGPLLGKAAWVSTDEEELVGFLQELRWVFPDAASADAWMSQNLQDLSEGMTAASAPQIGDRSATFGPILPGGFEVEGKPLRAINYVFRVDRVVVKLFVNSLQADASKLTALAVSPLAAAAADRVRDAQKSLGPVPSQSPVSEVTAPPPPVFSNSQKQSPPAEPARPEPAPTEERAAPQDIFVYEGFKYALYGRHLETRNLLNQPNRSAFTMGFEVGFPLFSGGHEGTTGFAAHDQIDASAEFGMRTSEEYRNNAGEAEELFAFGYGAHYSLAVGYRWSALGLLLGARPGLVGMSIGGITTSDPVVPLLALLEIRPERDVLVAIRGHYGFFLDQNAFGLAVTASFSEDFFLKFAFDQYRLSTAVPSDFGGDKIEVGRQVTTAYSFGFGAFLD